MSASLSRKTSGGTALAWTNPVERSPSLVLDGPCRRCGKPGQQWLIGIDCATDREFAWCGPACAEADGAWPPAILKPEPPRPARSRKPTCAPVGRA